MTNDPAADDTATDDPAGDTADGAAAEDVVERAGARLQVELVCLFEQIGADFRATYRLDLPDEHGQPEDGDLEDVIFDIIWATKQVLGRDGDETTTDPAAGQTAVGVMVSMLRPRLDELGVLPNPLAAFSDDAPTLLDAAGGNDAWDATIGADRPLLILRRVVRCHLNPEVPTDIYCEWWT